MSWCFKVCIHFFMNQEKCKQKCSKTSSTVPITILMLKSISGHGKGKGGKGNQKSIDVKFFYGS